MAKPPARISSVRSAVNPLDLIGEVSGLIGTALGDLTTLISQVGHESTLGSIGNLFTGIFGHTSTGVQYIIKNPTDIAGWMGQAEKTLGEPFVSALLTGALGLDLSKAHEVLKFPTAGEIANWEHTPSTLSVDSQKGINALAKLTAFIIGANLVFAGISGVAKMILAQRWESEIDASIGKIGEQLGLGWAMGELLGALMQVLAMQQLTEFANVQVHPARLDMPILMRLARQHHITTEQFWAGLDLQGYPDDLKALVLQMDTQQLLPADLQTLWSLGKMSRTEVETYLQHLGYSDSDVSSLLTLWIDHAESQELAQFRTTLRADYLRDVITQHQYQDMLAQLLLRPQEIPSLAMTGDYESASTPEQVKSVIAMAVASADFAKNYGRVTVTAGDLGRQLKAGQIDSGTFLTKLKALGYSHEDAVTMQHIYQIPPLAGKPGISTAKILSYTKSGALTPQQAYSTLVQRGMDPKDAEFQAWNPGATSGPWGYPSTVATVKQAYLDGVLDNTTADEALQRLGLTSEDIKQELTLWHWQASHPVLATPAEQKAGAHWEAAFRDSLHSLYKANGLGDAELVNLLEETGLTETDAWYTWAGWYAEKHGTPPAQPPSG